MCRKHNAVIYVTWQHDSPMAEASIVLDGEELIWALGNVGHSDESKLSSALALLSGMLDSRQMAE